MEYLKEKFSVAYGSKEYRENWEKTFGKFNPEKDCELYSSCEESDKCEDRCEKTQEAIETTEYKLSEEEKKALSTGVRKIPNLYIEGVKK